jgi:hypothetical protein
MAKLISVLHSDLTPESIAKDIVLDGFSMQRRRPAMLVDTKLPIPMAVDCRRRVAKRNCVHMDREFHSLFDKAVRHIEVDSNTVS